jgi:prepilin-type N-terminal cleavage/methylation domain-containing protein
MAQARAAGFTLIEILIALVIVAITTLLAASTYRKQRHSRSCLPPQSRRNFTWPMAPTSAGWMPRRETIRPAFPWRRARLAVTTRSP